MNYKFIQGTVLLISSQFLVGTLLAAPTMYVPTGESNEIVIIDLQKDKVSGRIDELENAHGLSSSDNTEFLVAGSMQVENPSKKTGAGKPAQMSEAEHNSHHANVTKGGKSATNKKTKPTPSFVSIVHPKDGHVIDRIKVRALTHHTAVSPDGNTAVVVHSGAGGISVIDLNRKEVISTLDTGLWPNYAVYSRDGKTVYVSNAKPGTVSEINTQTWKVTRQIKVGKDPEHFALGRQGKNLYVANTGSGSVSVIDLSSGLVSQTYKVGKQVHGIDTSADGRWLFVASKGDNSLSRVDLSNGKIISAQLKPAPYHVSFIPGQNKLYVSSRKQPKIWVIDPTTLAVKSEINLGKGVAHQMVVKM